MYAPSVFLRVALSAVLGAIIGVDRAIKRRPAGLKTHALVSMGASLVMLTGEYLVQGYGADTDIARLAAQVVSGVGFLGAGTIIVTGRSQVKGLTTAAGLWFSATLGLAVGIGFYAGVFSAMVFYFMVMRVFSIYDDYLQNHSNLVETYIEYDTSTSFSAIIKGLRLANIRVLEIERMGEMGDRKLVSMFIRIPKGQSHQDALALMEALPGVTLIEEI